MRKSCRQCGDVFTGEDWQKLCWTCWRDEKKRKSVEQAGDALAAAALAYRRGKADGEAAAAMDAEFIQSLIVLCHPDRHPTERAAQANAATARLLALRA